MNTRKVLNPLIILGIVFFIFVSCAAIKNISVLNTETKPEDEMLNIIMEHDMASNLKIEELPYTFEEIEKMKKEASKENYIKLNFITGYLSVPGNLEKADSDLKAAVRDFSGKTDKKLKAYIYYVWSIVKAEQEKEAESFTIFDKIRNLYQDDETDEFYIKLCLARNEYILYFNENSEKMISIFQNILDKIDKTNPLIIKIYYSMGRACWFAGRTTEGINYKMEALNIAEEKEETMDIVSISIDIGVDYIESENYAEAVKYLTKAVSYLKGNSFEERDLRIYADINLYSAYTEIGEYEKAEKILEELDNSIDFMIKENKKDDILYIKYLHAQNFMNNGNTEEALKLLQEVENEFNKTDHFNYLDFDLEIEALYGNIYYKKENYEKALEYHIIGYEKALEQNSIIQKAKFNKLLIKDYTALEEYNTAIKYAEEDYEMLKNKKSRQDEGYNSFLKNKYKVDENEEEIKNYEDNQAKNKSVMVFLAAIAAGFIVFLIYAVMKNKKIKILHKKLKILSITDPLTEMPNKRALLDFLSKNWPELKKDRIPLAFFMMDVDFFKKYNDNYGHLKGDEVLKAVADCIKSSVRNDDFTARYGGEEFVIILKNVTPAAAVKTAERIKKSIEEKNIEHKYSGVSNHVTVSIGIALNDIDYKLSGSEYMEMADKALYKAKEKRNCYYIDREYV